MKLILTSTDFLTNNSREIILSELKDVSRCKILYIPNENVTIEKIKSNKYYDRLQEYGFKKENIYVFNYLEASKFKKLDIDAIYIGGGNTFSILKMLKDTKFDKEIIKYVKNGVTYIGGSAGTHIATKNIEHVLSFDDNSVNLKDFNALGLFDGIIFCHYTDERKKYVDKWQQRGKYNITILKDDEFIIYDEK